MMANRLVFGTAIHQTGVGTPGKLPQVPEIPAIGDFMCLDSLSTQGQVQFYTRQPPHLEILLWTNAALLGKAAIECRASDTQLLVKFWDEPGQPFSVFHQFNGLTSHEPARSKAGFHWPSKLPGNYVEDRCCGEVLNLFIFNDRILSPLWLARNSPAS